MCAIETALQIYMLEKGGYPQTLSALDKEYLEEVPSDPWNRNYIYRLQTPQDFELFSLGPDGIEESDDDIRKGNFR